MNNQVKDNLNKTELIVKFEKAILSCLKNDGLKIATSERKRIAEALTERCEEIVDHIIWSRG